MPNYKYLGSANRVEFVTSQFTSQGVNDQGDVTFLGYGDVRVLSAAAAALLTNRENKYPFLFTTDPVGPSVAAALLDQEKLEALCFCLGDESTAITTAGNPKLTVHFPFAFTVLEVYAEFSVVGTTLSQFDVNEGGTSILGTKLTVDANEETSRTAATPATITDPTIALNAKVTFDVDTAGTGAKGAKIWLIGVRS